MLDNMMSDKIKAMPLEEKQSIYADTSKETLFVNKFYTKCYNTDIYKSMLANINKSFKCKKIKKS